MKNTNEAQKNRNSKKEKIKRFLSILTYIILIPLVIYNVIVIMQAVLNKTETPSVLGIKTFVVMSGSMEPELNIGDIVISRKVDEEEISIGDIISFRENNSIVTHRIVDIEEINGKKEYSTKGDNNNTKDTETVKYEKIEGKVIFHIPKLGNLTLLLENKILLIVVLIIVIIIILYKRTIREK